MILFSTFLIAAIVTTLLIPIFMTWAENINLVDVPNERKIHGHPIPRVGGLAMALAAFMPVLLWAELNRFIISVLIGSVILVVFGLIDDIKNLSFGKKFAGQIVAGLIVILFGGLKFQDFGSLIPGAYVLPDWVAIPTSLLVIVGVTNAINLSDGLDGLAGGISLISFLFIGYLSFLVDFFPFEIMTVAMVGAIFGLLRYNTHPAQVFMGDAGSQLLGFMAITLSMAIARRPSAQISPVLLLYVIGVPIIDTISVMVRRILEGRSPFNADKNHLHHKLMTLGFSHSEAVVLIYIIHSLMVSIAFVFRYQSDWFLLTTYLLLATALLSSIFVARKKGWQIKRYNFIDNMIKGPLRKLEERNIIIKLAFRSAEIFFISILILTCILPERMNFYLSLFAIASLVLIFLTWQIKRSWTFGLIEIVLFLTIPFIAYTSETDIAYLDHTALKTFYVSSFGFLVVLILATLKFTRRSGFKSTPLDFLILFIAIIVPNLPETGIQDWKLGFVATKIIVLYFTYEVLKGELRMGTQKLSLTSVTVLLIISVRGFIG